MRYYHVYTKGLENGIIFRDRDDYIAGMNLIAIPHYKTGVVILAFVLMSNHVHFVIYGRKSDVQHFISLYKSSISKYVMNRYGDYSLLRRVNTSCDEITTDDESIKRIIAYVLDNPVKAGVCCLASNYEWGSGSCYFTGSGNPFDGTPIDSIPTRIRRRILHSKSLLPSSYILGPKGYIDPASYVDFKLVEKIYARPESFQYFLSSSSSSRQSKKDMLMFSDGVLTAALDELLRNKYGMAVSAMDDQMKRNLILDLRKHFNASAKQLSRVTGLSLNYVLAVLG